MILVAGEILFDHFPGYSRVGGAPFNFACHLGALGFDVRFLTRVGNDTEGARAREMIAGRCLPPDLVQVDDIFPTGAVTVELDGRGNPTFDIREGAAYDHIALTPEAVDAARNASMIYFGTLAQRTDRGARTVGRLLEAAKRGTRIFYDINLRPRCYSDGIIMRSLEKCGILKLNIDELRYLKGMHGFIGDDADFTGFLAGKYTIDTVALTRGDRGSALFTGGGSWEAPPEEDVKVVDTVGAGDAYAAVLAAGILAGADPAATVGAAARFAAKVCGIPGALPDDDAFYDEVRGVLGRSHG